MSTFVPGSNLSASRIGFGTTTRPALSIMASMGGRYQQSPIDAFVGGGRAAAQALWTKTRAAWTRMWGFPETVETSARRILAS